jgi:ubiquinone/menaquinone biosynthesis C-methylase UbiE
VPLQSLKNWVTRIRGGRKATTADEVARVKASWDAFGKHDPLWAIVSVADKRGNRWDVDEFFRGGAIELAHAMKALTAAGIVLPRGRALDFGCGVGRLTQALAERFDELDGVDISPAMIAQARQYNRHGTRVRFHESASPTLPFADATFDFVFSKIVLQHVAVDLQRAYVREFLRVAKGGGLVVFQTVAAALLVPGTHFESLVETPDGTYTIDMNTFPRQDVEATITSAGGRLLHTFTDGSAGEAYESRFYAATRMPRKRRAS